MQVSYLLIPRSGSSNFDSDTNITTYSISSSNPSPQVRGTGTAQTGALNSYFRGYDIPGYHRRVKRGELLPHTPWQTFKCKGNATGSYRFRTGTTSNWTEWYIEPLACKNRSFWVVTEDDCASYLQDAKVYVQEAAARIYSSGFDLLTFAAEIVTLRSMFENALRKLLSLDFPRSSKRLADDWLELRYGWRTLMYDIKDITKLINTFNEKKLERLVEITGGSNTETVTRVQTEEAESYYDFFHTIVEEVNIGLRGGVVADITIPKIQANLAVTAWELVPFSFVIDWFLSVGKSICALSFLALQKRYAAFSGCAITYSRSIESISGAYTSSYLSGERLHSSKCVGTLKVRTPCSVPYTPLTSLRLDARKIVDLLALLVQRIRR